MSDIEKIQGITPNLTKENVDKLLTLFPSNDSFRSAAA